jgi:hypothetical protein
LLIKLSFYVEDQLIAFMCALRLLFILRLIMHGGNIKKLFDVTYSTVYVEMSLKPFVSSYAHGGKIHGDVCKYAITMVY